MVFSIDAEKAFDRNPTCFLNKISRANRPGGNIPQNNKGKYDKHTAKNHHNWEKLEAIPLKSGMG